MKIKLYNSFYLIWALIISLLIFSGCATLFSTGESKNSKVWVGSWSTAPMLVEPHNMPPAPGLSNNSLRQIVRVSIGGKMLRFRLSNVFSNSPVTINAVAIAIAKEGGVVDASTQKMLTFGKQNEVTIPSNAEVTSDPLSFNLEPGSKLAITIYFGETPTDITGHPGSRTTSYILKGNQISQPDFSEGIKTDHWYIINGIDVLAPSNAGAVAVLGNSITDGRGSGTNKQNRWTDILSERLLNNPETSQIGVLNLGIGGNCVVKGGLGSTALSRFDRDVLSQSNVRWLIILEGINDIGGVKTAEMGSVLAKDLINAYSQMIDKAHNNGIKVYGATILPFAKSFYDTDFRQATRDTVNAWIRNSGRFDAVIDFDQLMSDPEKPKTIRADLHDNDFLHPNELGYKKMGDFVNLFLFK